VLFVGAAVRYVEPELEEEALLVGSTLQVFLRVTTPRMLVAMGVAALWVLLSTAGEMTVTDLYRVRTYAEELYTGFALGDDLQTAWLGALPGILAGASLVVITFAVASAAAPSLQAASRPPWTFRLGVCRWPALFFVVVVAILIAAVPVGNLVYKAGVIVEQVGDVRVRHWSASKFVEVLAPVLWDYRKEYGWTILISALAATSAIALAMPFAWLARRGGRRSIPALLVSALCLATPGPLVGLGVIWLLDRDQSLLIWLYDRTVFAPVLAMLVRILPIAILLCWYALRTVPDDVLDSAACHGAGPWSKFWLIAAPQRVAAIAAAWLAAFVIASGDLACSILVVPPGVTTVPIRVFNLIHYGVDHQVAGVCLTMLAGSIVIAGTTLWLFRWSARSSWTQSA
jgi:iron(III) transport system permease protein